MSAPSIMEMELAIARYYNLRTHMVVPNVYWGLDFSYELDVLIVRGTGYCIEVEIKQSKSDLKADFKKRKWRNSNPGVPSGKRIKEFYYCLPLPLADKCIDIIPEKAGLMVCSSENGRSWVTIRKSSTINKNAEPLTRSDICKLGKLGTMRIWNLQETLISQRNEILNMRKYGLQGEFEYNT